MGSVENAKLVSWRVRPGASFSAGEVIYEIETDKTITEILSESDGVLALRVAEEGAELKVGDLIGWSAAADASADEIASAIAAQSAPGMSQIGGIGSAPRKSSDSASAVVLTTGNEAGVSASQPSQVSPHARRLAQEHGVDLANVRGTGPQGRITGEDVLRSAQSRGGSDPGAAGSAAIPAVPGYEQVAYEAVPNSSRRRTIARRLAESARAAPQLTADVQVDLSELLKARERENARLAAGGIPKISILCYIAKATAALLLQHRELNATYTDSHLLLWKPINLGIAVDSPDGLVVPVIRDACNLTLQELAVAIADVAEKARRGTLQSSELEGGTFTISNPGSLGPVLRAEAILNPPQVALLGVAAIHRAPIAVESDEEYRVEVRPLLTLSLTFDHRALDGGNTVRFLSELKQTLESPVT